jgi:hypothetical protein
MAASTADASRAFGWLTPEIGARRRTSSIGGREVDRDPRVGLLARISPLAPAPCAPRGGV